MMSAPCWAPPPPPLLLGEVGKWLEGWGPEGSWGILLVSLLPEAWKLAGLAQGKVSLEGSGFLR